ncbi:hypothetical protein [Yinghuangia soli]|uniref:HEAT repeat domain-containing protein n=1 Tax=Yinghuangia soli TaxID=2908204 RepID=A0AA41Q3B6_9ACTN|nr:hypothetical protein [Yinghuangia soli]MCF2530783.1 hypothetical protein [Yinghuangia soli]
MAAAEYLDELVRDLAVAERRPAASAALVAAGAEAAPAVLRELVDESSPVPSYVAGAVLRGIGMGTFDMVFEALVAARNPGARRRIGRAYCDYGTAALSRYTAALSHPDAHVRHAAVGGIRSCGPDALPAAGALLPLLGDRDAEVAEAAGTVLMLVGDAVVLRRVRRDGPGRLRSRALAVLADIGGESALSDRDRAAVERLLRIKLIGDRPVAPDACWMHWLAIPSGDQAGIIAALGLAGPRQVTFTLGNDVVDSDAHGRLDADHDCFDRVFVTPELDGWTFVMGRWCDPCDPDRCDDVLRLCGLLSSRYGRAQAYYYGAQGDGSAWLLAEDGVVVRRYCETGKGDDELLTLGEPLPLERLRRAELGLASDWDTAEEEQDAEDEWKWAAFDLAPRIAAAYGVSPLAIGADTLMRGTGVLALTPYATSRTLPAGAYRI